MSKSVDHIGPLRREQVAEYQPSGNVVPIENDWKENDWKIGEMRSVRRDAAGFATVRGRDLYPINDTVVIKNDVVSATKNVLLSSFDTVRD